MSIVIQHAVMKVNSDEPEAPAFFNVWLNNANLSWNYMKVGKLSSLNKCNKMINLLIIKTQKHTPDHVLSYATHFSEKGMNKTTVCTEHVML